MHKACILSLQRTEVARNSYTFLTDNYNAELAHEELDSCTFPTDNYNAELAHEELDSCAFPKDNNTLDILHCYRLWQHTLKS